MKVAIFNFPKGVHFQLFICPNIVLVLKSVFVTQYMVHDDTTQTIVATLVITLIRYILHSLTCGELRFASRYWLLRLGIGCCSLNPFSCLGTTGGIKTV